MQNIDYTALYTDNADFKRYVDRYCTSYRMSLARALRCELVHEVGKMYMEKAEYEKEIKK